MRALFSAESGLLFFLHKDLRGDAFVRVTGETLPQEVVVTQYLPWVRDWVEVEGHSQHDIVGQALDHYYVDRAAGLIREVWQGVSPGLESRILVHVESLLREQAPPSRVADLLLVAPLREDCACARSAARARTMECHATSNVMEAVIRLQPAIRAVTAAWMRLPVERFVEFGGPPAQLWLQLVHSGFIKALVEALQGQERRELVSLLPGRLQGAPWRSLLRFLLGTMQDAPEASDYVEPLQDCLPPLPTQIGPAVPGRRTRSPRRDTGGGPSAESGTTGRIRKWSERDLQERSAQLAAASGGGLRRHRASVARKGAGQVRPTVKVGKVEIDEPISVKSLSAATGLKAAEIIRKLMEMGTLVTANQNISIEMAGMAVADYDIELDIRRERTAEMEVAEQIEARQAGEMVSRAPVVTFLGHVDHGKTSLLDRIRHTAVAGGEAGGITQHIGSYRYDVDDKHVVFLDTPGHEAFTAMRARGANMTDVVVLVVAADDGVMPQTVEAIDHAKAANVTIVVALNKVDLPNANIQRAMDQLAERGLKPLQWGGNVEVIQTSATTGKGIDELVEVLCLEAELLELKAEIGAPASGFVIESEIDPARGVLARLLVRNGTLKVGDIVLAGRSYGRVRQIVDDKGREIPSAGPSTPVEIAGMDGVAEAGDKFYVVADLDQARAAADDRRQRMRTRQLAAGPKATLESLLSKIEQGETSEVPLIVKADVQGSIEALTGSLEKLSTAEAKVNILHAGVGGITTGDVALAEASGALIIGFNAVPDSSARQLAEEKGVDIRVYRVIYDIVDDIHKALEEGLSPEIREETLGRAEVRQVFKVSRVGTIAGCHVLDGVVSRNARVRVIRNNIVVIDERTLESLKRFKDDVREVRAGMECDLKIAGYDNVKEGDVLEFYQIIHADRAGTPVGGA